MWFTETTVSKIGRITTGGVITEHAIAAGSLPYGIALGGDGNFWITETGKSQIGTLNPTTFSYNECDTASWGSAPTAIAVGSDTALWFDEPGVGKIGRMTLGHTPTDYPIPGAGANPVGMVADPSGAQAMWFALANTNAFYRISTSGAARGTLGGPYALPDGSLAGITGLAAGPDGNVWFTENALGRIGTINPVSHVIGEYATLSGPAGITAGPDGAMWFTDATSIGSSTTAGTVTSGFTTPSNGGAPPYPIATGPDGSLWFADNIAHKIGRLQ
jgi:virginiamycin B lyase